MTTSVAERRKIWEGESAEAPTSPIAMRASAYLELAKARIALMVLISMAVGFLLGGETAWNWSLFLQASLGIVVAVAASSALNQFIERETDARMPRTAKRPLPTARLSASEVLLFGLLCGVASVTFLWFTVNATTALLTALTIFLYAGVYTPLKRMTPLCTVIGAAPGAAPPVLGWTAAGGELDAGAFSLFAILFLWQFPHFLAIAWMYRDQYRQAGLHMVPGRDHQGIIGPIATGYALALIPVSLAPVGLGLAGDFYGIVAVLLGVMYAWFSVRFQLDRSTQSARKLLWSSLVYLPVLLAVLTFDHLRLLS